MIFSWFIDTFIRRSWKSLHKRYELGLRKYKVGDLVTRHNSGLHRIIDIDYGYLILTVECLCVCNYECCVVGELESNLIRRYQLVTKDTWFSSYTREEVSAYLRGESIKRRI